MPVQAYGIIGLQSTAMLYLYMVAGYGVLRAAAPAYGKLVEKSQELAGTFRYVHTRLRTHAESVAFFGGDAVEGDVLRLRHVWQRCANAKCWVSVLCAHSRCSAAPACR